MAKKKLPAFIQQKMDAAKKKAGGKAKAGRGKGGRFTKAK